MNFKKEWERELDIGTMRLIQSVARDQVTIEKRCDALQRQIEELSDVNRGLRLAIGELQSLRGNEMDLQTIETRLDELQSQLHALEKRIGRKIHRMDAVLKKLDPTYKPEKANEATEEGNSTGSIARRTPSP